MDLAVFYEQNAAFGPSGVAPRPRRGTRGLPGGEGFATPWRQVWCGLRRLARAPRAAFASWERLWCCRLCGHTAEAAAFGVRLEAGRQPAPMGGGVTSVAAGQPALLDAV